MFDLFKTAVSFALSIFSDIYLLNLGKQGKTSISVRNIINIIGLWKGNHEL